MSNNIRHDEITLNNTTFLVSQQLLATTLRRLRRGPWKKRVDSGPTSGSVRYSASKSIAMYSLLYKYNQIYNIDQYSLINASSLRSLPMPLEAAMHNCTGLKSLPGCSRCSVQPSNAKQQSLMGGPSSLWLEALRHFALAHCSAPSCQCPSDDLGMLSEVALHRCHHPTGLD